jgi:hypothetical protein
MNSADDIELATYIGCAFFLTFGFVCMFSSILVIYICLSKCDRKSTEIVLTLIFCSLESITGFMYFVFSIFKLVYGYKVNEKGTVFCDYSALILAYIPRINIINISILASLRYLIFCRCKDVVLSTWLKILLLIDAGVTIFYSLGLYTKDAAPSSSYLYCNIFTNSSGLSVILTYFIPFLYIIPCWITTFCYLMVGWTANKRLNLMKQDAVINSDEALLRTIKKERFKLYLQILFVFYIYNINFALSYATWIMKIVFNYRRTVTIDTISSLQVASTNFLNPIVTIVFQPDINHEFKCLWVKFKVKIKSLFSW